MATRTAAKRTEKKTNGETTSAETSAAPPTTSRWTFLTNHSHVLVLIHNDPDLTLRQVALQVGITERAVQRIIHDLEADGFIERERIGRRNRYHVLVDQPLRHPIECHRNIGDLLKLVSHDD